MSLSMGTDVKVNKTLESMARSTTIMSRVSIGIALIALVFSIYTINSSNKTAKENQLLYKQQLQKLEEIKNVLSSSKKNS